MKTLLVLRHGKSSWGAPGLDDHDRPLKGRGKRASKKVAGMLSERGLEPDLVISSTAKRAHSTAKRVLKATAHDCQLETTRELYLTGVGTQLAVVARQARNIDRRVLIVGHNPTLEDLVSTLTGEEVTLTTANLAVVDLAIDDWSDLPAARGKLRLVFRPRELP